MKRRKRITYRVVSYPGVIKTCKTVKKAKQEIRRRLNDDMRCCCDKIIETHAKHESIRVFRNPDNLYPLDTIGIGYMR